MTLSPEGRSRASATGPLVISLSGLDGAGKTRQISALEDHLADEGRTSEVLWVPFRVWPEQLINGLPARWRSRLGPTRRLVVHAEAPARARTTVAPAPRGAPRRRRLARIAWSAVAVAASVSAGLSLRRRVARSGASVVILDRYRMDSIVKLQYWYHDAPPQLIAWVVRRLAPAPDVELLLRIEPEVAYARKPAQWSLPELVRQAKLYDDLSIGGQVVVLDGTQDPESLAAQVRGHVEVEVRGH